MKSKKWLISTAVLSILAAQGITANASHTIKASNANYHAKNPKGWPAAWGNFWSTNVWWATGNDSTSDSDGPDNAIVYNNGTSGSTTSNAATNSTTANSNAASSTSSASTASSSSASQAASQSFTTEGYGNKTTGGTKATTANTYYVDSFTALKDALKKSVDGPRKIVITKSIDGNNGQSASDYAKGTGYDFKEYLKAYNPSSYGMKKPSGDQETARAKAQANQGKNVKFDVPANTTITSAKGVQLTNVNFMVTSNNVIFQNLDMTAPVDDFPQWDGTDGSTGNWNSQYDAISLKGATNVWVTHSRFGDGNTNDDKAPTYYGRQYQQHDGLVDITDASDYVTVDYSVFENHDKTMLIGASDSAKKDEGKLHVTVANNYFHNTRQRTPRVRYGTVNVINNYYQSDNKNPYSFGYGIGAGYKSTILAQNNVADVTNGKAEAFLGTDGQHHLTSIGNVFNGKTLLTNMDNNVKTTANVKVQNADKVKASVLKSAGPQF